MRLNGLKNHVRTSRHRDLVKFELYQNNREADECYRSYAEVKEK